ncbi:hypothetical protein TrLO_g12820 [Triparma laevis f. longispina]|uniref:Uncharacterized protein n=1 Tax=Triparma laevis f. longispina TaxID=1714387 RepID=A0A9W7APN4_9STRA|nr:hypothetical protein TrLO_g12820 [Triparma laevis f. longispina]
MKFSIVLTIALMTTDLVHVQTRLVSGSSSGSKSASKDAGVETNQISAAELRSSGSKSAKSGKGSGSKSNKSGGGGIKSFKGKKGKKGKKKERKEGAEGAQPQPTTTKKIYIFRHGEKVDANVVIIHIHLSYDSQCLSEQGWAWAYNMKSDFTETNNFSVPDVIFSGDYGNDWNCRDRNGWYRTQQIIQPLAISLNITVNNSTGFLPGSCGMVWLPEGKPPYINKKAVQAYAGTKSTFYTNCITQWVNDQPEGTGENACALRGTYWCDEQFSHFTFTESMCCNSASATKILATLAEPDVTMALVAWEHASIRYLTVALEYPEVREGELCWAKHDFDTIYEVIYDCVSDESGKDTCTGKKLNRLSQGFNEEGHYLGPSSYCGANYPTSYCTGDLPIWRQEDTIVAKNPNAPEAFECPAGT